MGIHIIVVECFYNNNVGITGVDYIEYNKEVPYDVSNVKHFVYDLNKDKQVMMSDLVDDQMREGFLSKGIDASTEGNIVISPDGYRIITQQTSVKMNPRKLYAHMTDYALSFLDLERGADGGVKSNNGNEYVFRTESHRITYNDFFGWEESGNG